MRNAYRGTAKMYAADGRVLGWAKELLVSAPVVVACQQGRVPAHLPIRLPQWLAFRTRRSGLGIPRPGNICCAVYSAGKRGGAAAEAHPAGVCAHDADAQ